MPLNFLVEDHALHFPFRYRHEERAALRPYLDAVYNDHSRLTHWLAPFQQVPKNTETLPHTSRRASPPRGRAAGGGNLYRTKKTFHEG
jgi:hypothetical protein